MEYLLWLIAALMFFLIWCACVIGARADRQIAEMERRMLEDDLQA